MISIQRSNSELLTTYTVVSFFSHAVVYAFLIHSVPGYVDGWRYLNHLVTFGIATFAVAPIVGLCADLIENRHRIAQCGVILQLCGILFPYKWEAEFLELPVSIHIKMILLGLGFGLFHVFAAATVLRRDRGNCRDIGIFLAPGSLGIAAILIMPKLAYAMIPLLAFAAGLSDNCKQFGLSLPPPKERKFPPLTALAVLALLMVFALLHAHLPALDAIDRRDRSALLLLALALAAGKAAGGFLCDWIGPITVLAFPIGALLMGKESTLLSTLGVLLLAAAVPVIVSLVARLIPSAPGFAYGLCSCLLFPMAWITTRTPELLPSLPSLIITACLTALVTLAVLVLCGKYGCAVIALSRKLASRKKDEPKEDAA